MHLQAIVGDILSKNSFMSANLMLLLHPSKMQANIIKRYQQKLAE
jgi:hypothetical protein